MKLLDAIRDARLFAHPFGDESRRAWRTLYSALFADSPRGSDLGRYREATGRRHWPMPPHAEAWIVIGRRGGKSHHVAPIAVYQACFRDYSEVLAAGERGTLMVIAADKRQARTVFGYIGGLIRSVPMLEQMVEHETQERIDLRAAHGPTGTPSTAWTLRHDPAGEMPSSAYRALTRLHGGLRRTALVRAQRLSDVLCSMPIYRQHDEIQDIQSHDYS